MDQKQREDLNLDDTKGLTQLGSNETRYQYEHPCSEMLETFLNQYPGRDYRIRIDFPEFSSLCPKTGQPDFGKIEIQYIANKKCVESKSLKLYFFAWRNEGSFMETIVNKILNDFVKACDPKWCEVRGIFNPRGGIEIEVVADYGNY